MNIRDRIVEMRRVPGRELRANPKNFRTHPTQQRSALAGVLQQVGIASALIARETTDGLELIDGHLRAEDYGDTDWPVLIVDVTAAEADLLLATLDPLAALAEQDTDALRKLVGSLDPAAAILAKAALDDATARKLFEPLKGNGDPDDVPTAPDPVTAPGDIWTLGNHRLICASNQDNDETGRLLAGVKVQLVFTSPPYGVGVDYGDTYQDTFENLRASIAILAVNWSEIVVPGGFAVVNFGDIVSARKIVGTEEPCEYPMALEYWGPFREKGWLLWSRRIWCKQGSATGSLQCVNSNRAATNWEHIWTWKRPGKPVVSKQTSGDYPSQNGWFDSIGNPLDVGLKVHGAGMPAKVARYGISIHTPEGGIVFEPFSGTGTTIIAAEQLGRTCYAMEISPAYCDIAVARWEKFTGKKASREAAPPAPKRLARSKAKA